MKKTGIIIASCLAFLVLVWVIFPKGKKETWVQTGGGKPVVSAKKLYAEANQFKKDGELLKAQEDYQKIVNDFPDYDQIDAVQRDLGDLNMKIITSNVETPKTVIYEVGAGDSLGKIAGQFHETIDLIKRSNNLESSVIRAGQRLRIYKANFNIFVDKSQNILILKDGNDVVKVYHVSTGKNNSTPVGKFKIVSKLVDPVWFNKGVVVPPESPANVLGSRWLGFDIPGYGIHGTVDPQAIGQQVTAGCVRMRNEEVEEIYGIIPMGTEVTIVD